MKRRASPCSLCAAGAQFWSRSFSAAFLRAYLNEASRGSFLPPTDAERQTLLEAYLLEKALYEVGYELNNPRLAAHPAPRRAGFVALNRRVALDVWQHEESGSGSPW